MKLNRLLGSFFGRRRSRSFSDAQNKIGDQLYLDEMDLKMEAEVDVHLAGYGRQI